MLDQSFSYNNFRIIFDVENRKGLYLENENFFETDDIFEETRKVTDRIIEINSKINIEKLKIPKNIRTEKDYEKLNYLISEKENIKKEKNEKLEEILGKIEENINASTFELNIEKGGVKHGSQLYTLKKNPENYFLLKQLQRNIFKTFKVKQSNRKDIINQLKLVLDENFPKVVLRTDIKSFYESIPHKELLSKIDENSLLSIPSKKYIKEILYKYWNIIQEGGLITGNNRIGLPRGIGISAYLSELYLKDLDKILSSLPNVTFYSRYVDDIIIVYTPESEKDNKQLKEYKKEVNSIIESFKLKINTSKTFLYDFRKVHTPKILKITYLGYKFCIEYKNQTNTVSRDKFFVQMSDAKYKRFKEKIVSAFNDYSLSVIKYHPNITGCNKLLIQRIKFLTHNFQLFRRKDNVFVGVYFSNEFLTDDLEDLKKLDKLLHQQIKKYKVNFSNKI